MAPTLARSCAALPSKGANFGSVALREPSRGGPGGADVWPGSYGETPLQAHWSGDRIRDEYEQAGALVHRDAAVYDENFHTLEILPKTRLSQLLASAESYKIYSIHHQGIKTLAPGFVVEVRCLDDGMIEAIRYAGPTYIAAVRWHPEFHRPELGTLDDSPLLLDFLEAAQAARAQTDKHP